jgi:hypothetical protein
MLNQVQHDGSKNLDCFVAALLAMTESWFPFRSQAKRSKLRRRARSIGALGKRY